MTRYALYYAPRSDEALADFARQWFGRGGAITEEPRRYGFHGTLKPPFALAAGTDEAELLRHAEQFATRQRPFEIQALDLKVIDGFIALVLRGPTSEIDTLAASCVRDFDRFRAPSDEADLRRRRQAGLTPRQEEMLARWGYPYVFEEFRFHLTLTGRLPNETRAPVLAELDRLTKPFRDRPVPVRDLAIFRQSDRQSPFAILERFPLGGR
jgi:hypothetical protein